MPTPSRDGLQRAVEAILEHAAARESGSARPEIDVTLLMAQIRAELDSRLLAHARQGPGPSLPRIARAPQAIGLRAEYTLGELLAYNDVDFVRNGYRAILRREPNAAELVQQLELLYGQDHARTDLLWGMRRSAEGRKAAIRIRGLAVAVAVRRLTRLPVLGNLLGLLVYAPRLPLLVRNLERQEVLAHLRDREVRTTIDAIAAAVEQKAPHELAVELARRVAAMRTDLAQLTVRVADHASYAEIRPLAESALEAVSRLDAELASLGRDSAEARAEVLAEAERLREASSSQARDLALRLQAVWGALEQKAGANDVTLRLEQVRAEVDRKVDGASIDTLFSRERVEAALRQGDEDLDAFYVDFENRFRGSREEIIQRMAVYLPVVTKTGAGSQDAPVLDIGCGRGEWLELLRDSQLAGRGVDLNQIMVRQCLDLGLQVERGDALEHLRSLEAGSLGAITAMHVIEHLPLQMLLQLFDATLRALRPGGVAVFETPNPENLLVGACTFWFDPTHIHPLPPEAARFMAMARGFTRVEIMRLHPYPEEARIKDGAAGLRSVLNQFLYGAQDYSLVAYKA